MPVHHGGAQDGASGGPLARGTGSPRTDVDEQCQFCYQPEGWDRAYPLLALRYQKKRKPAEPSEPEQYQLFDTPEHTYRVSIPNIPAPVEV